MTSVTISIDDLELAAAPGWRACEADRFGDWLTGRRSATTTVQRMLYRRLGFSDHNGYHDRIRSYILKETRSLYKESKD